MSLEIIPLPYQLDPELLFEKLLDLSYPVLLDSNQKNQRQSRYTIFTAEPFVTITTRQNETTIKTADSEIISTEDPFQIIKQYLGAKIENSSQLPFVGGAIGYFAYDLARKIEILPTIAENDNFIPEMNIGIYDWAVLVDQALQTTYLVCAHRDPNSKYLIPKILAKLEANVTPKQADFKLESPIHSNFSKQSYAEIFHKIKKHIYDGDCYQLNLAQRFTAYFSGAPWTFYKKLRNINAAPFSAYLAYPEIQILSCSPERFLKVAAQQVETKPIKGTRKRVLDNLALDQRLITELAQSEKDRAENLMIVDLLRNDLGKNCRVGSIKVPELFTVESYASVHHLVSTITGELAPGKTALDLLRDCFPGGSITGAPKYRAMELIETYEPHRRSIYCGSIGYISFDGSMDSNIAIRTLICAQNKLYCAAGGGIVADSEVDAEYEETLNKIAPILNLLSNQ